MRVKNVALGVLTASLLHLTPFAAQGSSSPVRFTASSTAPAPVLQQASKKEILARLKTLQDQQIADGAALDGAVRKQLQETMSMQIGTDDLTIASRRTGLVTKKIDELNKRRGELNARREIVDRLIFQIDSKLGPNQKLQTFLEQTFLEMASADLADGRDARLWKAFTYLSMVMREVPESNEDVLNVFQGYLNFTSVLEPKTPADFIASRNYTNGSESAVANGRPRDKLSDGAPPIRTGPTPAKLEIRTSFNRETGKLDPLPNTPAANAIANATPTPIPLTPASAGGPNASAATAASKNTPAGPTARATPSGTMSGTSQSARELTAPASEAGLR